MNNEPEPVNEEKPGAEIRGGDRPEDYIKPPIGKKPKPEEDEDGDDEK